jgi:Holliday junction resolvasome RuvABC endonuclease subunit
MNNWGLARGTYILETGQLYIEEVAVVNPVLPTGKQTRQNSKDLEAAYQLYMNAWNYSKDANAVFVEVPVGSQNARAMASYGLCAGILGALRGLGVPFFEVTPTEVKLAGPGKKTATKQNMIDWAVAKHPEVNWPRYSHNGKRLISESKAEHIADAIATIYAGINSRPFQQLLPLLVAKP